MEPNVVMQLLEWLAWLWPRMDSRLNVYVLQVLWKKLHDDSAKWKVTDTSEEVSTV